MKKGIAVFAAFGILFGYAAVVRPCSLNTRSTYPTTYCRPPMSVKASSNPVACTNTYVMTGNCVQNRKDLAKNYQPTYKVIAVWNGRTQQATETLEFNGILYREYETAKAVVVSKCSNDPWMNDVQCTSGHLTWLTSPEDVKIKQHFPLTPGHINRVAVRQQLFANSKGPQIVTPKEYQKFVNPKDVLVVIKAGLPCGTGRSAQSAMLEIQKEKDLPTKAKGWVTVSWVNAGTRKVSIRNNGGIVKLANLTPGTWRVKARVISPDLGPSGDWRQFQVNIHLEKIVPMHIMHKKK